MNIEGLLSPHVIFGFELILCVLALVALLLGVFLAYRRLEHMERLLDKCSFVVFHAQYWGNSPRARMMRLCAITVAVLLPKRFLKRGLIDWRQVQEFPRWLKNLILWILFIDVLFLTYFFVLWLRE